jgi:hypothetical protein
MTSDPLSADWPISQRPGHPSMHVTHIPEKGLMSFPVRFFVNVAAVALILVYDILHFLLMLIVNAFSVL